jgi:ribosomal protein S18 acetylase RimI-like enzyme
MSLLWARVAGQQGDLPEGLTFHHHAPDPKHDPEHADFDGDWDEADHEANHHFLARVPEHPSAIGHLELRGRDWEDEETGTVRPRGEIAGIDVAEHYRRRGVGKALLDFARSKGFEVHHSPNRSPEGDAWSHAVDPGHGVPTHDFGS